MRKKRFLTMERRDNYKGYLFAAPWVAGFLLFFLYPLSQSFLLSFSQIRDISIFQFAFQGLNNYRNAFLQDVNFVPLLMGSIRNTLLNTPIVVVFSLFIAILLNRNLRLKGLYRMGFLLPVLLGSGAVMQNLRGNAAVVDFTSGMQGASSGIESADLTGIGLTQQLTMMLGPVAAGYLQTVLNQVSAILWMSGIQIILFLGALQTIPVAYYEAALCDGASEWEKFWKITLPLSMPVVLLVTIYTIIDYFTHMDNSVMVYIIQVSFADFNLAYGSALSWIYFLFVSLFVAAAFLLMRRHVFYMGDK